MPVNSREWNAGMTTSVRDEALENKYGEKAVDVFAVFARNPQTAYSADDVLHEVWEVPPFYVRTMTTNEDGTKTKRTIDRTDEIDEASEEVASLLDSFADDGLLQKQSIITQTGETAHYRLNPKNIRDVLAPVAGDQ